MKQVVLKMNGPPTGYWCSFIISELSEENTELQFCTATYSVHTLYSLPAVRSLSIGPCFLSHTGQARSGFMGHGRWGVREGWLIARKSHEQRGS